ncbi:MAG: ribosome silencing factor [Ectothiorhodospiraceae bacterium]|nr:ribosome silencing factor [Chromatiales bacterium]MCP5156318.1 ribosome silencing factor [Ectothiorhodospiraceae bacterium]
MESDELLALVIQALDDLKAQDIVALDVRELTDVTDYMVIATGRSGRQVAAIAEKVVIDAKHAGQPPLGVEGIREAKWVLIDLCDVVVHVMQQDERELYQLEKLWGGRSADVGVSRPVASV